MTLNVQRKFNKNKDEISAFLVRNKVDVAFFQDTELTKHRNPLIEESVVIQHYQAFCLTTDKSHNERKLETSSITLVHNRWIKNNIKPSSSMKNRTLTVSFEIDSKVWTFVNVYIHPDKADQLKQVTSIFNYVKDIEYCIIGGDMNAFQDPSLDRWSNIDRTSPHNPHRLLNDMELNDMVDTYRITNDNKMKFTRIGLGVCTETNAATITKTRLDHIWASKELTDLIDQSHIYENCMIISDHRPVVSKFRITKAKPYNFTEILVLKRESILYSPSSEKNIILNAKLTDIANNTENTLSALNDSVSEALTSSNITKKHSSYKGPRYINEESIVEFKVLKRKLNKWRKGTVEIPKDNLLKMCEEYKIVWNDNKEILYLQLHNKINNCITAKIRHLQAKNNISWMTDLKLDMELKPWSIVNKIMPKINPSISSVVDNDEISTSPDDVKRIVALKWATLFQKSNEPSTLPTWLYQRNPIKENLLEPITLDELTKAIHALKANKAAGPDAVFNGALKDIDTNNCGVVLQLLNQCLIDKKVPESWKHSRIYPIHKGGDQADMNNYRPIALISNLYKLLTNIINRRLMLVCESNNIIPNCQSGFRKNKDTTSNILTLQTIARHSASAKKELHVVYIDLTKAYDSVNHWALLDTLKALGFANDFVEFIRNINLNNSADIITAFGPSDKFDINKGLRQGDPMSPTLFNLFITPLLVELLNTPGYYINEAKFNILAFADDLAFIASSRSVINQQIEILNKFCIHNDLKVNAKKSGYAWAFTMQEPQDILFNDQSVQKLGDSHTYKYLGVQLSLDSNTDKTWKTVSRTYKYKVIKITHKHFLSVASKICLIKAIAVPTIAYAMRCFKFEESKTSALNEWTERILAQTSNGNSKVSPWMWANIFDLQKLEDINDQLFVSNALDASINTLSRNLNICFTDRKYVTQVQMIARKYKMTLNSEAHKVSPFTVQHKEWSNGHCMQNRHVVWTDGSFLKDRGGAGAVWWGVGNARNYSIDFLDAKSPTHTEALAIEIAVSQASLNEKLLIITDSEASVKVIQNWPFYSDRRKARSPYGATWRRIYDKSKAKNVSIQIEHIHSHLKENINNIDPEWKRKIDANKTKWESNFELAMLGNHQADQATKKPRETVTLPTNQIGTPLYTLTDDKGELWEGNISKFMKANRTPHYLRQWKAATSGKTAKQLHKGEVSSKLSMWPANVPFQTKNKYVEFKYKLLVGLPTKNAMQYKLGSILKKVSEKRKQTLLRIYSDEMCPVCNAVAENTEHLFTCQGYNWINTILAKEYTEKLEELLKTSVKIDWWFNTNDTNTTYKENTAFLMEYGNKGLVPSNIIGVASSLVTLSIEKGIDCGVKEDLLNEVIITLLKLCMDVGVNRWKYRCSRLYLRGDEWRPTTYKENEANLQLKRTKVATKPK